MTEVTSKMGLALALMCVSFGAGCKPLEDTLGLFGAETKTNDGNGVTYAYTPVAVVDEPATQIEAEPAYTAPEPVCHPPRWRGVIYDCEGNPVGEM